MSYGPFHDKSYAKVIITLDKGCTQQISRSLQMHISMVHIQLQKNVLATLERMIYEK